MFSQMDVTAGSSSGVSAETASMDQTELLREVLAAQDRTNEILEELVGVLATSHKQRMQELHQWKSAHPRLAERCRYAAEALSKVQAEYIAQVTDEIEDTAEEMAAGDFLMNEFVDRYGPRLAHLNGMIQVLAQLSSPQNSANQS
jgi:uncharacterized protein YydD (DUF2326 family)